MGMEERREFLTEKKEGLLVLLSVVIISSASFQLNFIYIDATKQRHRRESEIPLLFFMGCTLCVFRLHILLDSSSAHFIRKLVYCHVVRRENCFERENIVKSLKRFYGSLEHLNLL